MMHKKAQESRNDLLVWYVICFALVFIAVGSLYSFGIIGNYKEHSSSNKFTSAAVTDPDVSEEGPLEVVSDENISLNKDS